MWTNTKHKAPEEHKHTFNQTTDKTTMTCLKVKQSMTQEIPITHKTTMQAAIQGHQCTIPTQVDVGLVKWCFSMCFNQSGMLRHPPTEVDVGTTKRHRSSWQAQHRSLACACWQGACAPSALREDFIALKNELVSHFFSRDMASPIKLSCPTEGPFHVTKTCPNGTIDIQFHLCVRKCCGVCHVCPFWQCKCLGQQMLWTQAWVQALCHMLSCFFCAFFISTCLACFRNSDLSSAKLGGAPWWVRTDENNPPFC